jgi:hypothetical protein
MLSILLSGACSDSTPEAHPLQGAWEGHAILSRLGVLSLRVDDSGAITELLVGGTASTELTGEEIRGGPGIYTMSWIHETLGVIPVPFLADAQEKHAAIVPMFGPIASVGALERDGSDSTIFFESDIIGSWSGYGYAYDQDALGFAPFSPVTAEAVAGTPVSFSVTMPNGTITGVFPDFANATASWGGTAVNGAVVVAVMSPDKQFVAVVAFPPGYSSLEDLSMFALNREP